MIAYVPRERYRDKGDKARWDSAERKQWKKYRKYGAIYDVDKDSSRPAEPEEYEHRAEFKIFPDDIIGPPEVRSSQGNKSIHPDIEPGTVIHNWIVGKKVHMEGRREFRYECTCRCEAGTVSYLRANDLLAGRSHGCLKCMHERKVAAKNLTCALTDSMV